MIFNKSISEIEKEIENPLCECGHHRGSHYSSHCPIGNCDCKGFKAIKLIGCQAQLSFAKSLSQKIEDILNKLSGSRCGYMDSIELCDRIDKEELKKQLEEI